MDPELSLVLPCYNEEPWLEQSVRAITRVLDDSTIRYELILVDDASRDGTVPLIQRLIAGDQAGRVRGIFHAVNTGRGRAVADGMAAAAGDIVGFFDVDLEVPPATILDCCAAIRGGADMAVVARRFAFAWRHLLRRVLSRGYAILVHALLPVGPLEDTEAGCKFFRRATTLPVVSQVRDPVWFWDTESVVRCHLAGLTIVPVPCTYTRKPGKPSSVRLVHDIVTTLRKVWAFRRALGRPLPTPARRPAANA